MKTYFSRKSVALRVFDDLRGLASHEVPVQRFARSDRLAAKCFRHTGSRRRRRSGVPVPTVTVMIITVRVVFSPEEPKFWVLDDLAALTMCA